MKGLLRYSLERISSLQNFYNSEKGTIERKSKKGMKSTRFGYLMDIYFQLLVNGTETDHQKDSFLQLKKQAEQYIEILKTNIDAEGDTKEIIYRIINSDSLKKKGFRIDIERASSEYRQFSDMPIIHGNNTLIMLITRFEEFVANFISELYLLYPHKYLDKQQILFSEIENVGIENIRKKIVEREIDSIMRESYVSWFNLFRSHGMNFESCADELEKLKEIYARRNILVHNSGRVNESYIKIIPDSPFALGKHLTADDAYLNSAFDTIKIIVFTIIIESAKMIQDDKAAYIDDIFNCAYDELVGKQYKICYNVFDLLVKCPYVNSQIRTMSQINYWIAAKKLDRIKSISTDIKNFDVSALDRIYALAKVILLDENDIAAEILEDLYQKSELPAYVLEQWPLFEDFRKCEQYNIFKEKHPDVYGIAALETDPNSLAADERVGKSIRDEIEVAQLEG